MIAQTYVQIARMNWNDFEKTLEGHAKDRHVWHYVKGLLQPLVVSLKSRIEVNRDQQEKHEEAVQRFIHGLEKQMTSTRKKGFIMLRRKHTRTWKIMEKVIA